jgi:hypothetical protein
MSMTAPSIVEARETDRSVPEARTIILDYACRGKYGLPPDEQLIALKPLAKIAD